MTLAQRLMLAITILTIAVTTGLGLGVREAWRRAEEERFRSQFAELVTRLDQQLARSITQLPEAVEPVCVHDPTLDGTLVDYSTGRLDNARRLAASLRVPALKQTLNVDELVLVLSNGEILGAAHPTLAVGSKQPALAEQLKSSTKPKAVLRTQVGPHPSAEPRGPSGAAPAPASERGDSSEEASPAQPAGPTSDKHLFLEASCVRRQGSQWIGLYAVRYLDALLSDLGDSYGVMIRPIDDPGSVRPAAPPNFLVEYIKLEAVDLNLEVSRSRMPLLTALKRLDGTILAISGGILGAGLLVALLLARGLARPIADLAAQARTVVVGDPKPVRGRGGRELRELASAFNAAISDLAQLRKQLAATERIAARREIAQRVAHEIKNPLAPIRAAVETLRRLRARNDPAFDEYFDEATQVVLSEVRRINTIVSEFTRFARLPPPSPTSVDILDIARRSILLHENIGARIRFEHKPCPPMRADEDQMTQVLTNLLQNAIDACRDAADPLVQVSIRPVGGSSVEIHVRDNGPGVPPEIRERLFEPYATTKPHGTGLGLAIVQRIVVEHGGEINYLGDHQTGAHFRLSLPIAGPTIIPSVQTPFPNQERPT